MDDLQVQDISRRLNLLLIIMQRMDLLSQLYQSGTVKLTPHPSDVMTLSAAQKTGIKSGVISLFDKAATLGNGIGALTGVVGVPNPDRVQQTQVDVLISQGISQCQDAIRLALQDPDTARATLPADTTQELADMVATVKMAATPVLAALKARVNGA